MSSTTAVQAKKDAKEVKEAANRRTSQDNDANNDDADSVSKLSVASDEAKATRDAEKAAKKQGIAVIRASWREIKENGAKAEKEKTDKKSGSASTHITATKATGGGYDGATTAGAKASTGRGGGIMGRMFGGKKAAPKAGAAHTAQSGEGQEQESASSAGAQANGMTTFDVPQTFDEMMRLNARMTGANLTWIEIVLERFDDIVMFFCTGKEMEEESHVLALRIHCEMQGNCRLQEFRICMLATLRSLLPKRWDTEHEQAWLSLWDGVEKELRDALDYPAKYQKAVTSMVLNMELADKRTIGFGVWEELFRGHPTAESIFKQSNEKLCQIALAGIAFAAQIYEEPKKVVDEVTSLGLRHIMWQVDPQFFMPYVEVFIKEVDKFVDDKLAVEGFAWSLSIIAVIMARTIQEGNTPILQAAVTNDVKGLKKALAGTARGERVNNVLSTQVL